MGNGSGVSRGDRNRQRADCWVADAGPDRARCGGVGAAARLAKPVGDVVIRRSLQYADGQSITIVEGLFLLRDELVGWWDY
jgi:hypothetical protein